MAVSTEQGAEGRRFKAQPRCPPGGFHARSSLSSALGAVKLVNKWFVTEHEMTGVGDQRPGAWRTGQGQGVMVGFKDQFGTVENHLGKGHQ